MIENNFFFCNTGLLLNWGTNLVFPVIKTNCKCLFVNADL